MLSSLNLPLSTLIPVLVVCILTLRILVLLFRSPGLSIPGPFFGRFTKLWYLYQMHKGDFHRTNIKLHQENGPIVRLAPNWYSISDPAALKTIYGHGTKFEKSEWYDAWNFAPDLTLTNIFSERSPKKHTVNRRKVAANYSMTSLVAYEPFVDDCIRIFKRRLDEFAAEGRSIDMMHWLQCYAFDVIGKITLGNRFGFLDAGNDVGGIMAALDRTWKFSSYLGLFVWLYPLYYRLSGFLGVDQSYANNFTGRHINEAKATIKNYSADLPAHMAMKFVHAQERDPSNMTDWDILSNAAANLGAGGDTTALSLSSVVYHVYRDPAILAKLREEIDEAGIVGDDRIPTFKEVNALPYLQAVIKEALRVHPGTGFPLFRIAPKGGEVIAGKYFPEGTNVGVNSWVAHYDKDVYGTDAATFRPERWLEADKERLKKMEASFMPFGLGSRTCIGKNISLLEISMLIPVFVRNFELELSENIKKGGWEVKDRWFVKPKNFQARVTRTK